MHKIIISPLNQYDNGIYFNSWLRENYPSETGIVPDYEANTLTLYFSDILTPATEAAIVSFYHGIDEAAVLPALKVKRNEEVDLKTQELIVEGVDYDSKSFSLTKEAQINWIGIPTAFNGQKNVIAYQNQGYTDAQNYEATEGIYFPMEVTTIDAIEYTFNSMADFMSFYNAALLKKQNILTSGRVLKASINAASTVLELDAIIDDR